MRGLELLMWDPIGAVALVALRIVQSSTVVSTMKDIRPDWVGATSVTEGLSNCWRRFHYCMCLGLCSSMYTAKKIARCRL